MATMFAVEVGARWPGGLRCGDQQRARPIASQGRDDVDRRANPVGGTGYCVKVLKGELVQSECCLARSALTKHSPIRRHAEALYVLYMLYVLYVLAQHADEDCRR
ncbi:hypothetical protein AQI96_37075 [Streptomyces canus]|nr:hypothetical protein AQI96_37075 [Streptomyces canus]